jgi:outer membrane receptor protein involved in Fe transport
MSKNRVRGVNLLVAAAVASALSPLAMAQQAAAEDRLEEVEEVVVYATRYRDRTADTAPVLSYDLEYFQKFEPNTVGDMLKRVPGVGFVGSDIMEYDGVQMHGLGGGYTQVLINGKKVPGAGDDRSFWVDRIPAEMVERVEILRSNSANRSGDAVAGAINIILRDSYSFDGSYIRAGLNRWYDGEVNPTFGAVTSGDFAGGRILAGVNMQDRYRRKEKRSDRFTDPSMEEKASWEDQTEIKDGRDYSANLSYIVDIGETSRLNLDGWFVKTERDVTEVSFEEENDDGDTIDSRVPGLDPYDQKNWGVGAGYKFDMAGGTTSIDAAHSAFRNSQRTTEEAHSYVGGTFDDTWSLDGADWDGSEAEAQSQHASDTETSFQVSHKRLFAGNVELELGAEYREKKRDSTVTSYEWEAEDEGDPVNYELDGTVASVIKEKRLDPYVQFSGKVGLLSWEAGLRYETTDSDIRYVEDGDIQGEASSEFDKLLPSVHFKWDLTEYDRINLSAAKSVKRPNFNELIPALLDGEFGDNDYIGNPQLRPETALGFDLGYERRLGQQGVVGINFFYRRIKNLVELANTGVPSEDAVDSFVDDYVDDAMEGFEDANPAASDDQLDEAQEGFEDEAKDLVEGYLESGDYSALDADSWLFTSVNRSKARVYGVEFDLSTPLTVLGLPNTGLFANYSWTKSEVRDFIGERRFNDQARSVYNVGFIQDLPALGASFGATYRKQGRAFSRVLGEEVTVKYGDELDLFVEKRFGESFSVRLSANNLLDASKDEFFHKFDNQADQLARDYDEYELESEQAGPSYQLVVRWAF